jgi:hypothetical protein
MPTKGIPKLPPRRVSTLQDLYDDARDYLTRTFGVDLSGTPQDAVVTAIEGTYEGGWVAYQADFQRFMATVRRDGVAPVLTPLQSFSKMRAKVGGSLQIFRLKLHEEVVSVTIEDEHCSATIRTCQVETRRSRDKITHIGLKRITYNKVDYKVSDTLTVKVWSKPIIETVEMPTDADVLTWGRAWTADRVAADIWQAETCYRPGTDTAPMDGPIRKLEISHKEAFKDERFQNPTTA